MSSAPGTRTPSMRPPTCATTDATITTMPSAARPAETRYSPSSRRLTGPALLAVLPDRRLAGVPGLLEPLLGERRPDLLHLAAELRRHLHDRHAFVLQHLHVLRRRLFARLPAARLGGGGRVRDRLLHVGRQPAERTLVHQDGVQD